MTINNRLIQYTAGFLFLLAWSSLCLKRAQHNSDHTPLGLMVVAAKTNESITLGCHIRTLCLEITLFSNTY